jgi:ribonuclease J
MATLTFYGGVNEIGGNKILLEDGGCSLLLDFGLSFSRQKLFYEEYLLPRGGAGLLDPLTMGLIPPLEGLYRQDMEIPGLWARFNQHNGYRKISGVAGLLLSHAHMDHTGSISYLRPDIPIYATAMTAFLVKANQDAGKSGFDQQVCYFTPTEYACPAGSRQSAVVSSSGEKQQRQFCLGDRSPEELSGEARKYWQSGFWEKEPREKELISSPIRSHQACHFKLKCFPVDHSIPGACAWGIETSAGWMVYSGDLRLHGKRGELTKKFIADAAALTPSALILEGTNIQKGQNISEQDVYENAKKAVCQAKGLVIADFSARDLDRLLTFLHIAKESGRKLVILPKDAYLLKAARLLDETFPDAGSDAGIMVYQETSASKAPPLWLRHIYEDYLAKVVLAEDVNKRPGDYLLCFSFFDLNELPSIAPGPDGLYVFSSSEPHDEEQEIDFRRLHNWLDRFGIKGFGLPHEHSDGVWRIPDSEKGLHASGHACGPDLVDIALQIKPQILIPVHCASPELWADKLKGSGITVVLPALAQPMEILP